MRRKYEFESGRDAFSHDGARALLACVIVGTLAWLALAAVVL